MTNSEFAVIDTKWNLAYELGLVNGQLQSGETENKEALEARRLELIKALKGWGIEVLPAGYELRIQAEIGDTTV